MENQQFPPNSHRARRGDEETDKKEEKKPPVEVAIVGKAIVRKKSLWSRAKEMLIGGDSDSVINYLVTDVIVPQVKDLLTEAVTQGIERLVHGDGRPSGRRGSARPTGGYTNYNSRYSRPTVVNGTSSNARPPATTRRHAVDDVILPDRMDVQRVLDAMQRNVDRYGAVTVADLYGMVEWSATHTDGKWGWDEDSLASASVRRIREGYLLELPNPEYLE